MRVLVTGLGGFTGRYLRAELLAHGHDVVGLHSDLTDTAALNDEVQRVQPEWVVHLAGIAFVGHGEPNDFYRVNLMGTRNLLAALAGCDRQPQCVLLASSANVYGNVDVQVITEETPPNPANDYAVSKLAMEYVARLWMDKLPIVIVRPFNYTGVGQDERFLLPKIVAHFRRKKPVIDLGNLNVARDFSDVRMVAEVYRRLLETPAATGQTFNVCSGRAFYLRDVLAMMEKLTTHKIEVRVNPSYVRSSEVAVLRGSREKLDGCIGVIRDFPLEETLAWMLGENS